MTRIGSLYSPDARFTELACEQSKPAKQAAKQAVKGF